MLKFIKIGQQNPPKREISSRKEDFREIYKDFIEEKAGEQASRCSQCGIPFCQIHCPLSNNIPDWLKLTAEGRLQDAYDLAQSTNFQYIQKDFGSDNDQNGSGTLFVFNPSSTTFTKHFIGEGANSHDADISMHTFQAGYFNTTSAITGIQFKFASGNIDSGIIKLYGIKDS